jgi:predicted enzyme related to lactoylglutathione lyase
MLTSLLRFTRKLKYANKKEKSLDQQGTNEYTKKHGVFGWNDLISTDVKLAWTFCGELLGWTLTPFEGGEIEYTIAEAGDRDVAGMMVIPPGSEGMPAVWGSYVTVDDVDARTARAEQLGGKVCVPPCDIPNVGRFVVIGDPQGIMLG